MYIWAGRQLALFLEDPHLREFVSFLDYEQFAIRGGTGNLLNRGGASRLTFLDRAGQCMSRLLLQYFLQGP